MNIKKILKKICIGTPGEQVSVCMEMTGGGGGRLASRIGAGRRTTVDIYNGNRHGIFCTDYVF